MLGLQVCMIDNHELLEVDTQLKKEPNTLSLGSSFSWVRHTGNPHQFKLIIIKARLG